MKKKEILLRYILLIIGVFFIGMGIALARHSNLGTSPVSSVANVLSIKFPTLTVGEWLMLWNILMIFIQVLILRKSFKPIELLQFPISVMLGWFTDLSVHIVSPIPTEAYTVKIFLIILGVIVLALGITLTLTADTVMNVGEALVKVISNALHKNFGSVKVAFDIFCVSLSVILSLIFFNFKIVGAREGTIITACFTGFVVKFFTKLINKPLTKLIKKGL